jgi:hypothetical protein
MAYDPHTGFHYLKLLTYISYDYGSSSSISGVSLCIGYREVLN